MFRRFQTLAAAARGFGSRRAVGGMAAVAAGAGAAIWYSDRSRFRPAVVARAESSSAAANTKATAPPTATATRASATPNSKPATTPPAPATVATVPVPVPVPVPEAVAPPSAAVEGWKDPAECPTCPKQRALMQDILSSSGMQHSKFGAERRRRATEAGAATAAAAATAIPPPPTPEAVGTAGWTVLHSIAAEYPNANGTDSTASPQQQEAMKSLLNSFASLYPCHHCASHMREYMREHPPALASGESYRLWLCTMHNDVNRRLGKPEFDCTRVNERWSLRATKH